MTSGSSSYNLRLENIKHRIGMFFVVILLFFFYLIGYIISVQNLCSETGGKVEAQLRSLLQPGLVFGSIAMLSAVLLAVSGFRYLHSKRETDFYHSLPVRRRSLLYITVTNDLLAFGAAMAVLLLLECAVLAAVGYLSADLLAGAAWTFVCCLAIFAAVYLLMALAMILTGNTFVGVLGFAVLALYAPLFMRYLYPGLASVFFATYTQAATGEIFNYFSPVSLAVKLLLDGQYWEWRHHVTEFAAVCVWIFGLAAADYLVFEKRESEMAGKAMAFPKSCPVIRILIVIPVSIYTGLYLYTASFSSIKLWIVAGIVIGGFLVHGMIESIYRFDLRGMLGCKKQMVASIGAALAITGIFWADLPGYDTYLPEKEDAQALLIDTGYYENSFWGSERKGISGETMNRALDVLADVTGQNSKSRGKQPEGEGDSRGEKAYTITYRLKSGREKKRTYMLDQELEDMLLGQVFDAREYKEDRYSLYTADWSRVTGVDVMDYKGSESLNLTEEQRTELFNIYLDELSALTYGTAKSEAPVARLTVVYRTDRPSETGDSSPVVPWHSYNYYDNGGAVDSYFLYPSFEKTIRYIEEELGTDIQTSMEETQIESLSVWKYSDSGEEYTDTIDDQTFIRSIQKNLISSDLVDGVECFYPVCHDSIDITARDHFDDGERDLTVYADEETVEKIKKHLNLK